MGAQVASPVTPSSDMAQADIDANELQVTHEDTEKAIFDAKDRNGAMTDGIVLSDVRRVPKPEQQQAKVLETNNGEQLPKDVDAKGDSKPTSRVHGHVEAQAKSKGGPALAD